MSNEDNARRFNVESEVEMDAGPLRAALDFQRRIGFEALDLIVKRTPVDTGLARGNWQVTIGAPSMQVLDRKDKTGTPTKAAGRAVVEGWLLGPSLFISNSLPYIEVLEFGLYPNPPKHGSRIRRRDLPSRRLKRIRSALSESGIQYIVKSAGGFSLQAPLGMVGVTALELSAAASTGP